MSPSPCIQQKTQASVQWEKTPTEHSVHYSAEMILPASHQKIVTSSNTKETRVYTHTAVACLRNVSWREQFVAKRVHQYLVQSLSDHFDDSELHNLVTGRGPRE